MGSLGDFFGEEVRMSFAKANIKKGTVIKVFVKETNPPKEKRCIILGIDKNGNFVGTLLLNSNINWNVNRTIELACLQYLISQDDNSGIVDRDSYIDCSELFEFSYIEMINAITKDPSKILGEIDMNTIEDIIELVKSSPKISNKRLKRYIF